MIPWDPSSETWIEYQTKKAYHEDLASQIRSNASTIEEGISEQTKQIVASNNELRNSINSSIDFQTMALNSHLSKIGHSIDSLSSNFSYDIGLLIQETQLNNRLLTSLLDKIDAIQNTLDSPILTQARELYQLGCQQASKGLFDKALESLHKSEEIYDADFFTQYRIGYIYLFGVNDDRNVIDLEKAKQHLVIASRYAKAEIKTDDEFAMLAAESQLLASIYIYGQLKRSTNGDTSDYNMKLLSEAKEHAITSAELHPSLSEAWFHVAKYSALLSQSEDCVSNLQKAVYLDRNYASKVDERLNDDRLYR